MSRIGKLPVVIPAGVTVQIKDSTLTAKGSKGELSLTVHPSMIVAQEGSQIVVTRPSDEAQHRALHGLTRTLVANVIEGVSTGFSKKMALIGVGYKAAVQGKDLNLSLGFSHPVIIHPPVGISFAVEQEKKDTFIVVSGVDKQLVGQVAADIRKLRKPEPYKGKGIRYVGEVVRRKAGKSTSKKK